MVSSGLPADRGIMWRRVMDDLSFESARFSRTASGSAISGSVLIAERGVPLRVEYLITADRDWRTRAVEVEQTWRGDRRSLRLEHDGQTRGRRDGREAAALSGCTDVDLGVSPSTNALPVNRLRLPVGGRGEIVAAWVRFPDLDVTPARQSYERLAEAEYRYVSLASGFTAVVEVDADGLPIEYAGVWRRVAEGPAEPDAPGAGFVAALTSSGPSPELGDAANDFRWLIGGWTADVRDIDALGRVRQGEGEWWFAWTLEGRAIQDIWISPPRGKRAAADAASDRYGSTLRWFDRKSGLWRIVWVNPVSGAINALAGRREGDRILLLGEAQGRAIRWSFDDIRSDSFVWRGETRDSRGRWRLDAEFRLRRRS